MRVRKPALLPRLLCALVLACLAQNLAAAPFFKPFSASFSVWRGPVPLGDLKLSYQQNAQGHYDYQAHTQPGFLAGWLYGNEAMEESLGKVEGDRIVPERYRYEESNDTEDNTEVVFDWPQMKAHTSSGGVTWSQEIAEGTQDRLSQQLMVRLQLAQGHTEVAYQVADGGKLKHYLFRVVGEEAIKTPKGKLNCLRVERSKESKPADYIIWFAPELDYLPVRIERDRGGSHYRMVLDSLDGI